MSQHNNNNKKNNAAPRAASVKAALPEATKKPAAAPTIPAQHNAPAQPAKEREVVPAAALVSPHIQPVASDTTSTASLKAKVARNSAAAQDEAANKFSTAIETIATNVDTLLACNNIAIKTIEEIQGQLTAFGNNVFSQNSKLSSDFFSCRTFQDLAEFQTKIFQTNSEVMIDNASVLTEAYINYLNKSMEPIAQRVKNLAK
jgi:hypothetical protein